MPLFLNSLRARRKACNVAGAALTPLHSIKMPSTLSLSAAFSMAEMTVFSPRLLGMPPPWRSDIMSTASLPPRSLMSVPKSISRIECLETMAADFLPPPMLIDPMMAKLMIMVAIMKNMKARNAPTNEPQTIRINFFIITV